jgi:hypothetical protein
VCLGCGQPETKGTGEQDVVTSVEYWREAPEAWGIDYKHQGFTPGEFLLPEVMGGGVALFDCDGDDDLDVLLVIGSDLEGAGSAARNENRLYILDADGRYLQAPASHGLGDRGYGMGVAVGDMDSDGDLDLYITNVGPDKLYRNLGEGQFEDITLEAGIDVPGWSCSACFMDYDGDGDLDLYVTRYVDFDAAKECQGWSGRRDFCGPKEFPGVSDVLLRNDGGARFVDVSNSAGIDRVSYAGLGVLSEDFDGNGWTDLYVANDAYPNFLWLNQGDGTFRDAAPEFGVALNMDGRAEAGMGVASGDFDGDGLTDIFVTHLRTETNTLYAALPGGRGFRDATGSSQLGMASASSTGFGVCALDMECDGDLDLVVANGRVNWHQPEKSNGLVAPWDGFAEHNQAFLNDGQGVFKEMREGGSGWSLRAEVSRGLACGDVDRDGDLDLVLTNLQGEVRLFENVAAREGRWLVVRCWLAGGKVEALGAGITLLGVGPIASRRVRRSSGYLSSSPASVHFGVAAGTEVKSILVKWPDGQQESFPTLGLDQTLNLIQGTASSR